jgi:hypothetical protein
LVKTKLLIIYVRTSKSGNDGNLLEIKRWVADTFPMKGKPKVEVISSAIEMYNSPLALVFKVFIEIRE